MKLLTSLKNRLFPTIAQQHEQLLAMENELTQLQWEQIATEKALRKELEYIYRILIHRNGYRFQFHLLPSVLFLLLTVGNEKGKITFTLYLPRNCMEVANLLAFIAENTLVIEEIRHTDFVTTNKQAGIMLTQQIILEARKMGMLKIALASGKVIPADLSETVLLHDILGFAAVTTL